MIKLLLQVIIAAVSSWLLTRKFFRIKPLSDSILVSFLLFYAQIVLFETALGIAGQLYYVNLLAAHALLLVLVFLALRGYKMPALARPKIGPFAENNLLIFAAAVFLAFFLVKSFLNLVNPTQDADSLLYHLAFPAFWIKSGSLSTPFFIFGSAGPVVVPGSLALSSPSYYPINGELFFTWLMMPLRNAFLADLGEAPFYFIGIIAVYSILKKYRLSQRTALLSGFLLMLIPNILKQLKAAAQIDVIVMAMFLLVFCALLSLKGNFNFKNALLLGITAGLFAGIKFNNLIWLGGIFPLAVIMVHKGIKESRAGVIKVLAILATVAAMVILFGGFMYIKNYFYTGNPIFPVDCRIFGKTFFKGLVDTSRYKVLIYPGETGNFIKILREGLGVQFFALILPATLLSPFIYWYLRKKRLVSGEDFWLFSTPLFMLILFKYFIGVYFVRYLFPYLGLGLLTAVILAHRLPAGEKYFSVIALLSIVVAISELAHRYELVISIILSLALFALSVFFKKQLVSFYNDRPAFKKSALISIILFLLLLSYFNARYDKEEFNRYPTNFSKKESWQSDMGRAWKALNELTGAGSRVAYTGRQEAYPLFGERLKNEVMYISVNSKETAPYNDPDGRYREPKDFSAWMSNLRKHRIEYLFIALPRTYNREEEDPAKFPVEDDWAVRHPEYFKLLYSNSLAHIYKVSFK